MLVAYQSQEHGQAGSGMGVYDISNPEDTREIGFFDTVGPNSKGCHCLWWIDGVEKSDLIRDFGDDKYYNFADIPFFFFRLTVMFNPDVVESWTFPGTSGSKTSHWDLIKAAQ